MKEPFGYLLQAEGPARTKVLSRVSVVLEEQQGGRCEGTGGVRWRAVGDGLGAAVGACACRPVRVSPCHRGAATIPAPSDGGERRAASRWL